MLLIFHSLFIFPMTIKKPISPAEIARLSWEFRKNGLSDREVSKLIAAIEADDGTSYTLDQVWQRLYPKESYVYA